MCFPIQYALTWPKRLKGNLEPLDFTKLAKLEFEAPRFDDFPALGLARQAGMEGGSLPAVYNAANEVAVQAFREGQIPFPGIWQCVERVMQAHENTKGPSLDGIREADQWARSAAAQYCKSP